MKELYQFICSLVSTLISSCVFLYFILVFSTFSLTLSMIYCEIAEDCDDQLEGTYTYSTTSVNVTDEELQSGTLWSPEENTAEEYLQVSFEETLLITAVQVGGGATGWVTKYQIQYSDDSETWNTVESSSSGNNVGVHDMVDRMIWCRSTARSPPKKKYNVYRLCQKTTTTYNGIFIAKKIFVTPRA